MCKSQQSKEDMMFFKKYKYFSMAGEFSGVGEMDESGPI